MRTTHKIAALALMMSGLATAAAAQERNLQTPSMGASSFAPRATTTGAAPVWNGHEQPTESSLPPSVRRDESLDARQPIDPLGPLPQICKDC